MKSLFRGNPHDKGIVSIDRDLEDLIPGHLKNRRKDVDAIRDALKQGHYDAIEVMGHKMKGSGGGGDLDAITLTGRTPEHAADNRNDEMIRKAVESLDQYLRNFEIVYK